MKQSGTVFKLSAALALFGLVVLLLFSPCKVTDFFQSGPDGAKTQLLNKKIAGATTVSCQSIETSEAIIAYSTADFFHAELPFVPGFTFEPRTFYLKKSYTLKPADFTFTAAVALYILYQNFLVYS